MFLGTHTPRLDDKGRIFLPAKYRDELAEGLVLTKGQERCLYVFPQAEFARITEALRTAPVTAKAVRDYSRVFFASASDEVPDKQGRVTIPPALRDRMEVIQLPGYTEEEKLQIARRYLVRRQLEANGLKPEQAALTDAAIAAIVRDYTREAGVRNLEREIASICRKAAVEVGKNDRSARVKVTSASLSKYLGPPRFRYGMAAQQMMNGAAAPSPYGDMPQNQMYPTAIIARATIAGSPASLHVVALVQPGDDVQTAKKLVAEEIANAILH